MWKEFHEKIKIVVRTHHLFHVADQKMPKLSVKHVSTLIDKILKGDYKCKTEGKLDRLLEIGDIVERISRTNVKYLCKHSILVM